MTENLIITLVVWLNVGPPPVAQQADLPQRYNGEWRVLDGFFTWQPDNDKGYPRLGMVSAVYRRLFSGIRPRQQLGRLGGTH